MKTLATPGAAEELVERLARLGPGISCRWGTLTSREMLCHLGDSFRAVLGEMTRREWLRWGYAHVDHHLPQFGL